MKRNKPEAVQARKRQLLLLAPLALQPKLLLAGLQDKRTYKNASANQQISLPKDHAAHPEFKTEWWYFTGWLEREAPNAGAVGVQITFFRNAPTTDLGNPSRFTPSQLLFAHAAIALPERSGLIHDQIALRAGAGDTLIQQRENHTEFTLRLGSWQLKLNADDTWSANIETPLLALDLLFKPTQTPWLQGAQGFSKKGPKPEQASHYITLPQLNTTGRIRSQGKQWNVRGTTWMDHEWSTAVLDPRASGWDWIGINGSDGSALMAFVIRKKKGPDDLPDNPQTPTLWQHAELRKADGTRRVFKNVVFETSQTWLSPRTGVRYPVAPRLRLDELLFELTPLMNDQELDARSSTGTVYWEGAVEVRQLVKENAKLNNSEKTDTVWGRGYLELTGYWQPLKL
ncbi:MAG: carotenoid 1,2-hydratase [Burkholderiales bacterium]|nr:carotenoid 1,2-hydratase [Burkholderiales bacterium]